MDAADDTAIYRSLNTMGLIGPADRPALTDLTGGVSAEIVRVDLRAGPVCVKRSLLQLKVAGHWMASQARIEAEQKWIAIVGSSAPGCVPRLLGSDPANFTYAMQYFPPDNYPNWKSLLRDGIVSDRTGMDVGALLGMIHRRTAGDAAIAAGFANDADFADLRLRPYLEAAADRNPDAAPALRRLAARTAGVHEALVHGDFSPKNILVGPDGPVILDAECAWYGDPAFDPAFCLNHLLLKCAWHTRFTSLYLGCAAAFWAAYLRERAEPDAAASSARVASLLPGLMLARVDGKSPVEYLDPDRQHVVRAFAKRWLAADPATPEPIWDAWHSELAA